MGIKQLRLFDPSKVTSRQFEPLDFVAQGAKRYAEEQGLTYRPPNSQHHANTQRVYRQYLEYDKGLKSGAEETTPTIRSSYASLLPHIQKQYEFMTRPVEQGGLGITHEIVNEDPYSHPSEIAEDLRTNRRIKTLATASTNQGGGGYETHHVIDDHTNDMFRAIHDVFGHAGTGHGFNRHGEDAAYLGHSSMFPVEAREALASELRSQNAYRNFSPDESFPDPGNRMIGVPQWATQPDPVKIPQQRRKRGPKAEQLRLF